MKSFFEKNYLLLPVLLILIFLGTVFSSKYAHFNSLASVLSAQNLINSHRDNYKSLSYAKKIELISKIDVEIKDLSLEFTSKNAELNVIKKEKDEKQSQYDSSNQKLLSVNSQIYTQNSRISSLRSRIQDQNTKYKEKNNACKKLKGTQAQSCRNSLKNISENINNIKNQISTIQTIINKLRVSASGVQLEVNSKNTELRTVVSKFSAKESEVNKIRQTIGSLTSFRADVVDSTNNPDDPNPPKLGCTSIDAINWDSSATIDDGSCEYREGKRGCTDPDASNYDDQATIDDGSCYISCTCTQEVDPLNGEEKEAEKVTKVKVNITKFGGPDDTGVTATETGSVSKENLRSLDPNSLYTAWPMPGLNENNPNSPLNLPNIEKCFGPESESWSGETNARTNEALNDHYAEISYKDANGNTKTVRARIVDRGPKIPTRWDASPGMWKALGLTDKLSDPNDPNNMVDLEVKLVPKDGGSCGVGS